jgi:hypothetical protein
MLFQMFLETKLASEMFVTWMNRATERVGQDMDCLQVVDQIAILGKWVPGAALPFALETGGVGFTETRMVGLVTHLRSWLTGKEGGRSSGRSRYNRGR